MIPFQIEFGAFPIHSLTRLLLAAYLIEAGFVLIATPWTSFWMRNYFAHEWPIIGHYMANIYVRSAVTAIGAITAIVGLLDLFMALVSRREGDSAPSITPANGPQP